MKYSELTLSAAAASLLFTCFIAPVRADQYYYVIKDQPSVVTAPPSRVLHYASNAHNDWIQSMGNYPPYSTWGQASAYGDAFHPWRIDHRLNWKNYVPWY